MDELAVLARHRPDPAPPTAAERAALRALVVEHARAGVPSTTPYPSPLLVDVGGHPGRTRRRVARALALGAAAAIVVVAVVLARTGDERDSTPADETTTAPVSVPPSPYPAPPFTVEVAVTGESTGGSEPRTVDGRIVVHQVDGDLGVADVSECDGCEPTGLMLHVADIPAEGPVAEVRAAVEEMVSGPDPSFRLGTIIDTLGDPGAGPVLRAELLRALGAIPDLDVTADARTALGAVGTRYAGNGFEVVIDPEDGYVLELTTVSEPQTGPGAPERISTTAGYFAPDGRLVTVTSFARPVAEDRIPADVADLAEVVRAGASPAPGQCRSAAGNETDGLSVPETPVPEHLVFAYCPEP